MEITEEQYCLIEDCLSRQCGNASLTNLQVLNAILFVTEQSCKWRGLPKRFGRWHTVYTRWSRWSKAGGLDRVFEGLQHAQLSGSKSMQSLWIAPRSSASRWYWCSKKQSASYRQVAWRMDKQNPFGSPILEPRSTVARIPTSPDWPENLNQLILFD